MFIRKTKNQSGSVSVQIIKKINRINKVIKTIGSSKDPDEIERLFQKGLYELPRLLGATLFDDIQEPDIGELSNDNIRVVDPELVFGKIFDHVGFSAIIGSIKNDCFILSAFYL
jgi:hypothetical protein